MDTFVLLSASASAEEEILLTTQFALLTLLLVASLGAVAFKRLHFPYTVGLTIIGLALGLSAEHVPQLEWLNDLPLSHDLILFIFLPPLIFESALNLDGQLLLRNLTPVMTLAGPGLLLAAAITGTLVTWLTPLNLGEALLFGTLISATDPVAVIALFKEFGVPKRLMVLVEGESLFNDASAIVVFGVILYVVVSGDIPPEVADYSVLQKIVYWLGFAIGFSIPAFLKTFFGGLVVGAIIGSLAYYPITLVRNNQLIQATISLVIAYGVFIVAEHGLHVSGVVAVVAAGSIVAWAFATKLAPEVRHYLGEFWEYAAFLANSLIFLLVGIHTTSFIIDLFSNPERMATGLIGIAGSLVVAIAAILISRATSVFGLTWFVNLFQRSDPVEPSYQIVSYWGGLRGAVGLALALSLPEDFGTSRDLIIVLTLGVALFTLLVPGTTIGNLIHRLKLDKPSILDRVSEAEANLFAKSSAQEEVKEMEHLLPFFPEVVSSLDEEYRQSVKEAEDALEKIYDELRQDQPLLRQVLWLQAINLEQKGYGELYDRGLISEVALNKLHLAIDLERDSVLAGRIPPQLPQARLWSTQWERWATKLLGRLPGIGGIGKRRVIARYGAKLLTQKASSKSARQRQRERQKRAKYEYDAAVAYVCEKVGQEILRLAGNCNVRQPVAEDCARAFRDRGELAAQELQGIASNAPELATNLQQGIAHRTAAYGELEAIERLEREGAIASSVAAQMRQVLEPE